MSEQGEASQDWLEQLVSGDLEEYVLDTRKLSSVGSGSQNFEWGFVEGFWGFGGGLRRSSAWSLDNWRTRSGLLPNPGTTAEVPLPAGTGQEQSFVQVTFERVSVSWPEVDKLLGTHPECWEEPAAVLGTRLAYESERVYHFAESGGLLTSRDPGAEIPVPAAASYRELWEALRLLPFQRDRRFCLPAPNLSNRGVYLFNPDFWSGVVPPDGVLGSGDDIYRTEDPFLHDDPDRLPPGSVLAAYGDWRQAFTIVTTSQIRFRVKDDELVADTVTAGSVNPPFFGRQRYVLLSVEAAA